MGLKKLTISVEVYEALEKRTEVKGLTIAEYLLSLVRSARKESS